MRRAIVLMLAVGCARGASPEKTDGSHTMRLLRSVPGARAVNARPVFREGSSFVAREGLFTVRFADHAGGGTRLERSPLVWIEVAPEGLANVATRVEESTLVYRGVADHTDAAQLFDGEFAEELRVLHSAAASRKFSWRVRLGPAIAKLSLDSGALQALDSDGRARFRTQPLVAWDAEGRERALSVRVDAIAPGEARIVAELDAHDLKFPVVVDPAWGLTGNMGVPRYGLPPVKLLSGKVFVAGGRNTTELSTAEVFDPATLTWTLVAPMKTQRRNHGAALLPSGKVLVFGGFMPGSVITPLAEIYDPTTNTWTDAAPYPRGVVDVGVTTVGGKVIAAGGSPTTGNDVGYVFDETTGAWSTVTNKLSVGRYGMHAIAVTATRAWFVGGFTTPTATDFWDSTTGLFSVGPSLSYGRYYPGLAKLTSGRILVVSDRLDAELYDPALGLSLVTGISMQRQNSNVVAPIAGDRAVFSGNLYTNYTSDIFDGASKSWSLGPNVVAERHSHFAVGLDDGRALIAGGQRPSAGALSTSEIYGAAVAAGTTCTASGQCSSGFCVDGLCCDRACTGACEVCNDASSKGTCITVTGAPRPGHGTCTGSGACGGTCDGASAACTYASIAVSCVTATCVGGLEQPAAYCNGAGACGTTPPTRSCGLFTCGATSCKTTCAADADCVATAYCNTTTSLCEAKRPSGGACTTGAGCASGFCASGVCCDKACAGACESCNASGSVGTCQLRAKDAVCGADACVDGALTVAAKCDGASPACPAPAPTPCPSGFACADGTTCKTSCATGADCTTGYCDLATGKCGTAPSDGGVLDAGAIAEAGAPKLPEKPAVGAEFTRCAKNAECSTGHCVEGVCCDTACTEKCSSCALLSSPGKCTVEPIGVDLRNECGPANQCLGTCDGTGQCIGAGTGTMCARNRCNGPSSGVGPAYCSAPGAKCVADDAVAFDCSPYICEAAFGACRASCAATADCANGFVCDVPSKTCVPTPAPAEEEGGCATGRGTSSQVAAFGLILALVGIARRRALRDRA